MRWRTFAAGATLGALVAAAVAVVTSRDAGAEARAPAPPPPSPEFPGGHPIDAARVATGRLAFERMPQEVTTALELHSDEIVKTARIVETKQARITGSCAPGSAIRLVQEDGTVVCQRFPRGVLSVSSLAGVPRSGTTRTTQGAVAGAVGRYQIEGEDDFLVVPLALPDGAIVTSFSFTCRDNHPRVDGAAYLYRSDDVSLAALRTEGAHEEILSSTTEDVKDRRVDNARYAYFVYMRVSPLAAGDLMPVSASVAYRLP